MAIRFRFAFLAACLPLAAQPIRLDGPVNGVIYDRSSHSIRPILGAAMGAHLGPALLSDLENAWVAPDGRTALTVQSGRLILIPNLADTQTNVEIDHAISHISQILWSVDSSTAILAGGNQLQRISNLHDAPQIQAPKKIGAPKWGGFGVLALDPAADKIAVAIRSGERTVLAIVSDRGEVAQMEGIQNPAAAAFSRDGLDLYVADRTTQRIVVFRNAGPGASSSPFLDGAGDVVALASQSNLLVATRAPHRVRAYDFSTLMMTSESELDSEPELIEPVPGSSYLRLTSPRSPGDILWLMDARVQLSPFFVPSGESR